MPAGRQGKPASYRRRDTAVCEQRRFVIPPGDLPGKMKRPLFDLTQFIRLPYKSCDSVQYGNPVQIRSGPATVSAEERSHSATGAKLRWEGGFNPAKREPGDRLSSHRFKSTSEGASIAIQQFS